MPDVTLEVQHPPVVHLYLVPGRGYVLIRANIVTMGSYWRITVWTDSDLLIKYVYDIGPTVIYSRSTHLHVMFKHLAGEIWLREEKEQQTLSQL